MKNKLIPVLIVSTLIALAVPFLRPAQAQQKPFRSAAAAVVIFQDGPNDTLTVYKASVGGLSLSIPPGTEFGQALTILAEHELKLMKGDGPICYFSN